jgi:AcrR family transcriptional regulator
MRSNVRRNRLVLLQAARDLFATGDDVPMYEVASRAGVGQATLYRHFPSRSALAAAVGHQVLDDLEELTDDVEPSEAFYALLRGVMSSAAESAGLVRLLREGSDADSHIAQLEKRLVALFARPLRDAKAAGSVREDMKIADVLLLIQMLQGVIDSAGSDSKTRARKSQRGLKFLLDGIRPSSASG